jgi:hypothetical protein
MTFVDILMSSFASTHRSWLRWTRSSSAATTTSPTTATTSSSTIIATAWWRIIAWLWVRHMTERMIKCSICPNEFNGVEEFTLHLVGQHDLETTGKRVRYIAYLEQQIKALEDKVNRQG